MGRRALRWLRRCFSGLIWGGPVKAYPSSSVVVLRLGRTWIHRRLRLLPYCFFIHSQIEILLSSESKIITSYLRRESERARLATGADGKVVRDGWINRYRARSSTPDISKLPRAIVSGAVLNSVFGPDPSSSSSSSSSASGVDGDEEVHTDGVLASEKGDAPFLVHGSDVAGGSGSKQLTKFVGLGEECDRFTDLIKARVVNTPENFDGEGFPLWERQKQPFEKDEDLPSYYSKAAMEAKEWFKGRKLELSSEFDLDKGTSSLSPISAHLNSGETGSPADMARSYTKERQPWSSQRLEVPDPKEDAFLSIGWNSLSSPPNSQLKRNSPITGSWNISEEIKRVRSWATKEMLRTVSSPKVDKSSAFMPGSPLILRINWSDSTPVDKNAEQRTANHILVTNLGDDEVLNATRTLDVLSETAIPEVAQVLPEGVVSDSVAAANGLPAFAPVSWVELRKRNH